MRQELKYLTIATRTTSPSSIIKAPQKDTKNQFGLVIMHKRCNIETSSC